MEDQNKVWEVHKRAVAKYLADPKDSTAEQAESTYQDWLKALGSENIARLHPHWMYYNKPISRHKRGL